MKKIIIALLMLTLTGCSAAQAKEEPVSPPAVESNLSNGEVAKDAVKPVPEEPSKAVEPISEPVIGESAQTVQPATEQPKQPEPVQSKPVAKPVTPTQPVKTEPTPVTQQPQQRGLTGWVEYHTDDIKNLSILLNDGSVIYHNGKYYASPEYVKAIQDAEINFKNDIPRDSLLTPDAEYKIVK
ncbi:MAG: hypothetical protein AB7E31_16305 [Desulfitobacterium sp.]